ncbi:MAG: hypothetical protein ACLP59_22790 [Bryobacteraceae bacterium]
MAPCTSSGAHDRNRRTDFGAGRAPAAVLSQAGQDRLRAGAWIHVCASNTEPLLRLAAHARSEAEVKEPYGGSSTAHPRNSGCIRGFRVLVYGHSEDASYDSQPIAGRHSSVFRFIAVRQ